MSILFVLLKNKMHRSTTTISFIQKETLKQKNERLQRQLIVLQKDNQRLKEKVHAIRAMVTMDFEGL